MVNNIIKVLLLVIIVVLAYMVYDSIMEPVKFNQEVNRRNAIVVQSLKDIRNAEMSFKSINGRYTASFDTLIDFLKNGQIPEVKIIPDPNDTTFTKTIRDTIGYVPVADSLFGKRTNFDITKIKYIPFTDGQIFKLDAGVIDRGGVSVNVFEASALYKQYLADMDKQMVTNLIASKEQIEKFPGLKVGSMTEASTDGNWE
ncbi:MAG: hypothetical protein B6D61_12910 [Bacteroidetes bacterium 4484_249]|nr:MAG: hypothetical protein B6D61_12910 [Bacteroidetes bacterium 4484_249]